MLHSSIYTLVSPTYIPFNVSFVNNEEYLNVSKCEFIAANFGIYEFWLNGNAPGYRSKLTKIIPEIVIEKNYAIDENRFNIREGSFSLYWKMALNYGDHVRIKLNHGHLWNVIWTGQKLQMFKMN